MSAPTDRAPVRALHDRVLDAAASVFDDDGWRRLTMAKVADRAGVSRQTVYNGFGTKAQLAEQLVMRELETFLEVVRVRFVAQVELVPAVRAAVEGALDAAQSNALLKHVLEGDQAGDSDLLPFIFLSQELIDRATDVLRDLVVERFPELAIEPSLLDLVLESVVRLVLSHISRPSRPPRETADELGLLVGVVLHGLAAATIP